MSHEIEVFSDNSAAFFSARVPAWHQLGTVTDQALSAEDALRIAQLDWQVTKQRLLAIAPNGLRYPVENRFATMRQNPVTGEYEALGVVGPQYHIIQNHQAFAVLNDIVGAAQAHFETAGSLNGGRKVFVTLKLPAHLHFGGKERHDLYLLASTTHDATGALMLAATPVRVVCANTESLAFRQARRTYSIRHTVSAQGRIAQAREALDLTFAYTTAFQEEVEKLLSQTYTEAKFEQLVEQLLPLPREATDLSKRHVQERRTRLLGLWHAPTQDGIRDTAWGALQSVIEYADWYAPVRAQDSEKAVARASRVVNGQADLLKQRAYELITS